MSAESSDDEWFERDSSEARSGRQLLLFSDSRQDAAFFACYLNRTYSQILRRRLILATIDKHANEMRRMAWRVSDFVEPLRREADACGLFDPKDSKQEQIRKVWKWILLELMSFDRRNSLEGLGLLAFRLAKPDRWRSPAPLLRSPWNLTDSEVWALFEVLLDSLRLQGAIAFPEYVDPTDPDFEPRNREYFFRREGSEPKLGIFSWCSSRKGSLNRRRDFILKLAERVEGTGATPDECDQLLTDVWDRALMHESSPLQPYLRRNQLSGQGVVHQLRTDFWELAIAQSDEREPWFFCDTCTNLTLHNVKGTCPTFRCEGSLIPCSADEVLSGNHYRYVYRNLDPVPLRAEEHTAQLTNTAASELQDKFLRRDVNVLSCSTTFELGVDVGELQAVLMRNVPPSTANYIQRAGRAGRRKESTAFVTTFAQRRSHDLTYFHQPESMVAGKIKPPYFEIRNEKIVRRHIHAVALAAFWQDHPEYFGSVDKFFFSEAPTGPEQFRRFLDGRPEHVKASLERVVPKDLARSLGLNTWSWIGGLFDQSSGVLTLAEAEVRADVQVLEALWARLVDERKPSDWVLRMINTMKARQILDALSSHNVIPKYGFPVDVVELQLMSPSDEARRLTLERDLRIALSEYAPGGEVVAGGKLWTSTRVKKVPDREWPRYEYAICQNCRRYQRVIFGTELPTRCIACSKPLDGKGARRPFIVPEFGFVSEDPPRAPAESRPERTYTTSVFFSGETSPGELKLSIPLRTVTLQASAAAEGRLAIINRAGFKICHSCGYSVLAADKVNAHTSLFGRSCTGTLRFSDLGHEFKTDVLDIRLVGFIPQTYSFWLSLLYALLEGASETLYISRDDLHGCLYPYSENAQMQAIILFDDVPGGAGHVRRLVQSTDTLRQMLISTLNRVKGDCGCDHDTSCYGCLRNYKNQPHHDELERGLVYDFLANQLSG
ncbi:MAG TPA: Zn-binding domain-containing protein [Candidatus Obscuribacterales bacterium]